MSVRSFVLSLARAHLRTCARCCQPHRYPTTYGATQLNMSQITNTSDEGLYILVNVFTSNLVRCLVTLDSNVPRGPMDPDFVQLVDNWYHNVPYPSCLSFLLHRIDCPYGWYAVHEKCTVLHLLHDSVFHRARDSRQFNSNGIVHPGYCNPPSRGDESVSVINRD